MGFLGGSVVKNPPVNAGDARDVGSITGLGRSPGEGNDNHAIILAWKTPWTEDAGPLGSKELDMTEHTFHTTPRFRIWLTSTPLS